MDVFDAMLVGVYDALVVGVYDALVVGGGPAGLSAATWLARHRRRVAFVHSDERRNRWVERTHGYLGLDPLDPAEPIERATKGLLAYPWPRSSPPGSRLRSGGPTRRSASPLSATGIW